jgi:ABC-type antimicrobial peptide transport system ATPase subunit
VGIAHQVLDTVSATNTLLILLIIFLVFVAIRDLYRNFRKRCPCFRKPTNTTALSEVDFAEADRLLQRQQIQLSRIQETLDSNLVRQNTVVPSERDNLIESRPDGFGDYAFKTKRVVQRAVSDAMSAATVSAEEMDEGVKRTGVMFRMGTKKI